MERMISLRSVLNEHVLRCDLALTYLRYVLILGFVMTLMGFQILQRRDIAVVVTLLIILYVCSSK